MNSSPWQSELSRIFPHFSDCTEMLLMMLAAAGRQAESYQYSNKLENLSETKHLSGEPILDIVAA